MHLAGVILTNRDGEILLLHRATPKRTQWEIPGGKIEEGEEAAEAAAREALEELGTDVEILQELGSESFQEDGHSILYTWFLGTTRGKEPGIGEPDKYDEVRYWSMEELTKTTEVISPNTRNFVTGVSEGRVSYIP